MSATYISLHSHIIFATKGRAPVLDGAWRGDLFAYLGGTVRGLGATPHAIGGVADHVHLVLGLKATHDVASLVREIKKSSSSWVAERCRSFAWQVGYAAFSVGYCDLQGLVGYAGNQEDHHRKVSSTDELLALLEEFGIAYDKRFFE